MSDNVLCLNAGSSSLKFAVYQVGDDRLDRLAGGAIERIGTSDGRCWLRDAGGELLHDGSGRFGEHVAAAQVAVSVLRDHGYARSNAIGHRIVHGGDRYAAPVRVDEHVLEYLRDLTPFAPLHQPPAMAVIEQMHRRFPDVPQVACFDTALHRRLPEVAQRFALPRWLWDEGVRHYGFHGLSYEYVLQACPQLQTGRTIIAHLGHGSSMTAFLDGVPQETTMGFTPTGGFPMSTRSGDLDPGILLHLLRTHGFDAEQIERLVTSESGLKGISGQTGDMRQLLSLAEDDPAAAQAIEAFCYHAAKSVAALTSVLEGVDRLVFTGGVGEHAAPIRAGICRPLGFLGITIDESRNAAVADVISSSGSRCEVRIVPTDEEQIIARHTAAVFQDAVDLDDSVHHGVTEDTET